MKLVKISEHNAAIEIYRVHQPSKAYKKLFPKRFTFALQFGNKVQSGNENMLPLCATFDGCIGYVFTTQNLTLPSMRDDEDFGNTFPVNLNQYFITDIENYDLIFEITPTHSSSPKFNESVVLRMKSEEVLNSKTFAKDTLKRVSEQFNTKISIEEFVMKIINTFPLNFLGFPVDYPKVVKNSNINSPIKLKNLFVAYDFRPTTNITHDDEVKIITAIEDSFEDKNLNIVISDNYNGILEKLVKEANDQKIKYRASKEKIEFKLKDFRKLKFKWNFTDLI